MSNENNLNFYPINGEYYKTTRNFGYPKPDTGKNGGNWGNIINRAIDEIDEDLSTLTQAIKVPHDIIWDLHHVIIRLNDDPDSNSLPGANSRLRLFRLSPIISGSSITEYNLSSLLTSTTDVEKYAFITGRSLLNPKIIFKINLVPIMDIGTNEISVDSGDIIYFEFDVDTLEYNGSGNSIITVDAQKSNNFIPASNKIAFGFYTTTNNVDPQGLLYTDPEADTGGVTDPPPIKDPRNPYFRQGSPSASINHKEGIVFYLAGQLISRNYLTDRRGPVYDHNMLDNPIANSNIYGYGKIQGGNDTERYHADASGHAVVFFQGNDTIGGSINTINEASTSSFTNKSTDENSPGLYRGYPFEKSIE